MFADLARENTFINCPPILFLNFSRVHFNQSFNSLEWNLNNIEDSEYSQAYSMILS